MIGNVFSSVALFFYTSLLFASQVGLGNIVSIEEYGAIANDGIDDTKMIQSALNSGKNVFIPIGVFETSDDLMLMHRGQMLIGENKDQSVIERQNPYGPIVVVVFPFVSIENIRIQYNQLTDRKKILASRNTHDRGQGAIIYFGDISKYENSGKGWGSLRNLILRNGFSGLENDHHADGSGVFSWSFENLYIRKINGYFIRLNPANSGNSGNVFSNIYLANARQDRFKAISALEYSDGSNSVFNQLNIEAMSLECGSSAIQIQNVSGLVINGLHIEDLTQCSSEKSNGALITLASRSQVVISGVHVNKLHVAALNPSGKPSEYSIFRFRSNGKNQPRLSVNEMSMRNLDKKSKKIFDRDSALIGFKPAKKYLIDLSDRDLNADEGFRVSLRSLSAPIDFNSIIAPSQIDNLGEILTYLDIEYRSRTGDRISVRGDGNDLVKRFPHRFQQ
jgi:hypothetical protein